MTTHDIISSVKISEIGEFGLITRIEEIIDSAQDKSTAAFKKQVLGIGDDTAAWEPRGLNQLATADCMVAGVHFQVENCPWRELGWKALAANVSDIAAMGGIPDYALICLTLPPDMEDTDIYSFYRGMTELANEYGLVLTGGNISSAPLFSVTITVIGSTDEKILKRSGAKAGDLVAVTGNLGGAAGYVTMLKENSIFDADSTVALRRSFFHPEPRVSTGRELVAAGITTALDISDGILSDLRHICQASQIGARVYLDKLPLHPSLKKNFGDRALELAIGGGEDYELLFCGNKQAIAQIQSETTVPVSIIGEITPASKDSIELIDENGTLVMPTSSGWDHFNRVGS